MLGNFARLLTLSVMETLTAFGLVLLSETKTVDETHHLLVVDQLIQLRPFDHSFVFVYFGHIGFCAVNSLPQSALRPLRPRHILTV